MQQVLTFDFDKNEETIKTKEKKKKKQDRRIKVEKLEMKGWGTKLQSRLGGAKETGHANRVASSLALRKDDRDDFTNWQLVLYLLSFPHTKQ